MDRTDHCDRPHAWQRYLAKVSLPRMGTDSIVERHRRSACAWAGSYAACAEAIHLFPILTIALTASTASGLDLVLRLQSRPRRGRLFQAFRKLSPHLCRSKEARSGVMMSQRR